MGNQVDQKIEIDENDVDPVEAFAQLTQEDDTTTAPAAVEQNVSDDVEEMTDASQSEDDQSQNREDEQQVDVWEGATESQLSELNRLRTANADLEHRHRSSNGRVSALQKQLNAANEQNSSPTHGNTSQDDVNLSGFTAEQIQEFEEDYGDVATYVKALTASQVKSLVDPMQRQVSSLEQTQSIYASREQEDALSSELNRLASAHPDYVEIQNNNKFWDWLNTKPAFIQQAVESTSADDNIELLNQFKRETTTPQRETRTAAQTSGGVDLSSHAELPRSGAAKAAGQELTDPVEIFNAITST